MHIPLGIGVGVYLPRLMLRIIESKNLEPLRENMFDFKRGDFASSLEEYNIPALKVHSAETELEYNLIICSKH